MTTTLPLLLAARLDWGLGNPNKTAALIAVLMVGVWALAWMRSWGFWMSLVACAGLSVCLLLTASRGGLLAAVAGLACVLVYAPRPWPKVKVLAVGMVVAGLALIMLKQTASWRYVHGIRNEDRSITNRLLIWKHVPRMILDAPTGWGFGNAGWAYMEWYQPVGRLEGYRTLVSSHLTWLVEGNWLVRIGYVLGWCVVFVFSWPNAKRRWFSVTAGIWVAFWVGALFSSVAESPWMWVVPLYSLAPVLFARHEQKTWPSKSIWVGSITGVAAILTLLFVCLVKGVTQKQPIHGSARLVRVGAGDPAFWIVSPDPKIVGLHYGQEIRRKNLVTVAVNYPDDLPAHVSGAVVLTGCMPTPEVIGTCHHVILLNPPAPPDGKNSLSAFAGRELTIVWGMLRDDLGLSAWQQLAQNDPAVHILEAPNSSLYLSHWGELLLQAKAVGN